MSVPATIAAAIKKWKSTLGLSSVRSKAAASGGIMLILRRPGSSAFDRMTMFLHPDSWSMHRGPGGYLPSLPGAIGEDMANIFNAILGWTGAPGAFEPTSSGQGVRHRQHYGNSRKRRNVGNMKRMGGKVYVDTAFINSVGPVPGVYVHHMGFGEFYADTPAGRVDFDRMHGKDFAGQSGRSHELHGPGAAWLVKEMRKRKLIASTPRAAKAPARKAAAPKGAWGIAWAEGYNNVADLVENMKLSGPYAVEQAIREIARSGPAGGMSYDKVKFLTPHGEGRVDTQAKDYKGAWTLDSPRDGWSGGTPAGYPKTLTADDKKKIAKIRAAVSVNVAKKTGKAKRTATFPRMSTDLHKAAQMLAHARWDKHKKKNTRPVDWLGRGKYGVPPVVAITWETPKKMKGGIVRYLRGRYGGRTIEIRRAPKWGAYLIYIDGVQRHMGNTTGLSLKAVQRRAAELLHLDALHARRGDRI